MAELTSTSRAVRADVFYNNRWPLLILILVGGLIAFGWFILAPPSGCQNMNLNPIHQVQDGTGRQVKIFQVPDNSWAVVRMDGIYKVLDPGENFLMGMGLYVCQSPQAAQEEVSNLNAARSSQP